MLRSAARAGQTNRGRGGDRASHEEPQHDRWRSETSQPRQYEPG